MKMDYGLLLQGYPNALCFIFEKFPNLRNSIRLQACLLGSEDIFDERRRKVSLHYPFKKTKIAQRKMPSINKTA
jgi:hypothetical protein